MAKFYVQCASYSLIIDAVDAQVAAMHLIDTAMQPHLWIYDDAGLSQQDRHDHLMLEALLHLAPEITVSEQGFGRPDASRLGTPETVSAWHQTMSGVSHLLVAAGLVPRTLRQLAEAPLPTPIGDRSLDAKSRSQQRCSARPTSDAYRADTTRQNPLPLRPIRKPR